MPTKSGWLLLAEDCQNEIEKAKHRIKQFKAAERIFRNNDLTRIPFPASIPLEALGKAQKSQYAAELSKLGPSKGGTARAASLSKEQRSAIAKKAGTARWAKKRKPLINDDGFKPMGGWPGKGARH